MLLSNNSVYNFSVDITGGIALLYQLFQIFIASILGWKSSSPSLLPLNKKVSASLKVGSCLQMSFDAEEPFYLSHVLRKPVFGVSARSDTNQSVQPQKIVYICRNV